MPDADRYPALAAVTGQDHFVALADHDRVEVISELAAFFDDQGDPSSAEALRAGDLAIAERYFQQSAAGYGVDLGAIEWDVVQTDLLFSFDLDRFFEDPVAYLDSAPLETVQAAVDQGLLRFEPADDDLPPD